jgi:lauroyl/myristoyl acyltransferase
MVFATVRGCERIFSPRNLRRILKPLVGARVVFKRARVTLPLPACLGEGKQFQVSKQRQRSNYLNAVLEFFPERLGTAKWRDHVRISGIEYLENARREKRSVALAFCHFGPYVLIRYWLRAAGFPAAALVEGKSVDRPSIKRLKDRASPFPEIPTAFCHEDQLREMLEFVTAGNPLLMALDVLTGKQMVVPVDAQWRFGMASGAIRVAIRQQAELIPCTIIDEGGWRFQIKLGPPVPGELMKSGDATLIGKNLLEAMLPEWRAHPGQCTERLVKLFQRIEIEKKFRP